MINISSSFTSISTYIKTLKQAERASCPPTFTKFPQNHPPIPLSKQSVSTGVNFPSLTASLAVLPRYTTTWHSPPGDTRPPSLSVSRMSRCAPGLITACRALSPRARQLAAIYTRQVSGVVLVVASSTVSFLMASSLRVTMRAVWGTALLRGGDAALGAGGFADLWLWALVWRASGRWKVFCAVGDSFCRAIGQLGNAIGILEKEFLKFAAS